MDWESEHIHEEHHSLKWAGVMDFESCLDIHVKMPNGVVCPLRILIDLPQSQLVPTLTKSISERKKQIPC